MAQRGQAQKRWEQARRREQRAQRQDEAFLLVTLAQGMLCALMVAAAFILSAHFHMTELKAAFSQMLSQETRAVEVFAAAQKIRESPGAAQARAAAQEFFSRLAGDALTVSEAPLDGQGGWHPLGLSLPEQIEVPQSVMTEKVVLSAPMAQPVAGRLTSPFGYRAHPLTGQPDFHTGVDIAAPLGTPIGAVYPGVVSEVGESTVYGKFIVLDHGRFQTRYCHCDEIIARVGLRLRQSETVATVGSTGVSTGPHLHLELRIGGRAADPMYGAQNWTLN